MDTKQYFPRKTLKEEGKKALSGHWGKAIVIMLIGMLVGGIPSIMSFNTQMHNMNFESMDTAMGAAASASTSVPGPEAVLLGIVLSLIGAVLLAGYTMATSKWYLDLVQRNPNTSLGDFFGNFNLVGKGILVYLWMSLWMFIWMLIPLMIFIITMAIGGVTMFASEGSSGGSFIFVLLMLIAFAAYMVIAIWKSYSYGQMYNIIADNPTIGVRESMRHSIAITKDYILDLFVLDLSFVLWGLLIVVTAGLAAFYVGPYMSSTYAMTYFFLRDQALDKGILSPEVFGLERRNLVEDQYIDETIQE